MSMTWTLWRTSPAIKEQLQADLGAGKGLPLLRGEACCRLEKSGGALHFVLTGTAWEGEFPASFLLHGGVDLIEPEDEMDSVPRWIPNSDASEIAKVLDGINAEEFVQRCDAQKMVAAEVYSVSEDRADDLREELEAGFAALRQFVAAAVDEDHAIVVSG